MIRFPLRPLGLASLLTAVALQDALAADAPALPDPLMTPGAVDPSATVDVICNRTTKERRLVTSAMKAEALAAYNIPAGRSAYYEIDHLVPLAIGGANAVTNLWPQPWVEADAKDVLEVELQRRVCHGSVTQAEAQRAVADDWVAAYARYVGGAPAVADTDASPQGSTEPAKKPSMTARWRAAAWRIARRWIVGF